MAKKVGVQKEESAAGVPANAIGATGNGVAGLSSADPSNPPVGKKKPRPRILTRFKSFAQTMRNKL